MTAVEITSDLFPWVTRDEVFRVETPRLWLRWPRLIDGDRLQAIASLAAVAEMTATWPHPLPAGEAGRRITAARALNGEGKGLVLAATLKREPDRLVGTIGSGPLAEGAATIGYMFDPAIQGRGLATEAVRAFVRVLFTHVRAETVAAAVRTTNPGSRRVLEKNGFELIRTGLHETKVRGSLMTDFLELPRGDWRRSLAELRRLIDRDRPSDIGREAMH